MSDEDERARFVARQIVLQSLSFGRRFDTDSKHIARLMREQVFPAGSVIYRSGDPATHIYWVVEGDVELLLEGASPSKLAPPSVIGIMDAIQDRPHKRTAVARTRLETLSLRIEDWLDVMEDNFDYAYSAVRGLSATLHTERLALGPSAGLAAPEGAITKVPRRPLNLVERMLVLRHAPVFAAASVQGITRLAGLAEERRFTEGEWIVRRGDPTSTIPVVARGLVRLMCDAPRLDARVGPGALVGGYANLGLDAFGHDAQALAPTSVIFICRDDLFDLLQDNFEVTRSVLAFLIAEREALERLPAGTPVDDEQAVP